MKGKKKKFLTKDVIVTEKLPRGIHHWLSTPEATGSDQFITVRVEVEAGNGHAFHKHPDMEEIIYILSGRAEQWLEDEKQILEKDEAVFIPENIVHAIYNTGDEPLNFLAILSPAKDLEGTMVDVSEEEPWCNLRD